jgi:sulfide dehydrogenase [flavocytochrome c] flavoprotein chain
VKPENTMTDKRIKNAISRRQLGGWAAGGLAAGLLPLTGRADDDESGSGGSSSTLSLAVTGLAGKQVVVCGGGMAGMTVAKCLRLWGGSGDQVTRVEPDALYTSSIMSKLVLNGSRNIASLQFTRDALSTRYGVVRKAASLVAVDALAHKVTLSDHTELGNDRRVLAPVVSFDDAYGLTQADYDTRTPGARALKPRCCAARWSPRAMATPS